MANNRKKFQLIQANDDIYHTHSTNLFCLKLRYGYCCIFFVYLSHLIFGVVLEIHGFCETLHLCFERKEKQAFKMARFRRCAFNEARN